ncbi:acetyltransferase (GNAT) family protein [Lentzea atacamensis]|uniref:Acetyltransferase (GNAT) family protein n=1 Tax=Lentzea atacamensis TaxID=531938 RepID=A0A316HN66_9PSEU|nr:GNAT family N-acetyltransferase [Lentzea atacamensis]PWK81610.1 acetyltransferase (GNAT) family protein [Lentzea atacamensis]RAS62906.1 acetyltransferase (GNAT) family protein [Lentzea atacamensis]
MELRRLTLDDLTACSDLAESRSWPREESKWAFLLTHSEGWGLFDDQGLAGTTVVTRYPELASISMVLVAERCARQGHGRRLVSHVLDTGVSTLFATEMGRPLYEQLGFRAVGFTDIHAGVFTGPVSNTSHLAVSADLDELVALDAKVTGITRPFLWESLLAMGSVRLSANGVAGSWRVADDLLLIGPVIADSPADACALIADSAAGNGRARVDVHDPEVVAFVRAHGMESWGESASMVRNADQLPGDRARYHAPILQALG